MQMAGTETAKRQRQATPRSEQETWQEQHAALERDAQAARVELDGLRGERPPLVLRARTGDAKAKAALGELDARIADKQTDVEDLDVAVEQAAKHVEAAREAIDAEDRATQAHRVARLLRRRAVLAKKVDALVDDLAGALSDMADLNREAIRVSGARLEAWDAARPDAFVTRTTRFLGARLADLSEIPTDWDERQRWGDTTFAAQEARAMEALTHE